MEKIKNKLNLIIYFFLAFLIIMPFFHSGIITMHDNTQVVRVLEMGKELSDGNFPVRFVGNLGYGMGYPIFNFYSPLPYYIGGVLTLSLSDPLVATKIIFILATVIAGVGVYFLVKNYFGREAGILSSIVYLYFPYHAVNIYVRGDLAELFAYAFIPFVFLSFGNILRKIDEGKKSEVIKWRMAAILSLSAVILSHNLSAFMLMFFLVPFLLFQFISTKKRKDFIKITSSVFVLSFLITSFYTIPAVFEMKYTNVLSQVGGGAHYADHFVCPVQFWDSPWGFGGSAKSCLDGMSFRLGKINILLFGLALTAFIFSKRKHAFVGLVFFFFLFAVFLTTEYSSFIWKLPYVDFLQYPWRFLNFSALFLSMIIGYLISQLNNKKLKIIISILIISITLITNLKLFTPQGYEYVNYKDFKYLRWTASKISDEYLPRDFEKPKSENQIKKSNFDIVEGKGSVNNLLDKTRMSKAEIELSTDSLIRINKAFFPGRQILIDGKKAEFSKKEDGLYFPLPKGKHEVETKLTNTFIQNVSNALSLIGIFGFLIGIILLRKVNKQNK